MQSGVLVGASAITGTLKNVTDYTGFSDTVSEQSGHFLAIHVSASVAADSITVETNGGAPMELAEDGIAVLRITDNTQYVTVTAIKGSDKATKTYSLTGLTLQGGG